MLSEQEEIETLKFLYEQNATLEAMGFEKKLFQDTREPSFATGVKTILIIEDERLLLRILTDFFESEGYNVIVAEDGKEGFKKFQSTYSSIDLVVMDMGLPSADGLWVFERMKELRPDITAIFMTGFTEPKLLEEMKSEGVKKVLQKPFDPFTLLCEVKACLN